VGAAPILVKVDWSKVANVASIAAAPFTGGTSLALNAGLRGGAVGVKGLQAAQAGRKAAQAGKGLTAAQAGSKAAQTASMATEQAGRISYPRGPNYKGGAATKRFADAAGKDASLGDFGDLGLEPPKGGIDSLREAASGAPPSMETTKLTEGTGFDTGQTSFTPEVIDAYGTQSTAQQNVNTAQAHKDKMDAQHGKMKNKLKVEQSEQALPIAGAGAGAYGVNQMKNRAQAQQAKQQAEMERIEGIAEAGRTKSTTGGGQVAVTA
jgi:hypothetical protein